MGFNAACPACDGPVNVVILTVKCAIPIKDTGWTVMATHRNTNGSEYFSCPKCDVTVPAEWVYKNMSLNEAQRLMKEWGANVYSIHNRKPLPPVAPEEPRKVDPDDEEEGAVDDVPSAVHTA